MSTRAAITHDIKQRMANALLELMREKPYDKITINEITTRANVGRVSYFRHFKSKEAILVFQYLTLAEQWMSTHELECEQEITPQGLRSFFEFHYHYRDTLLLLRAAGLKETAATASFQFLMSIDSQSDDLRKRYRSRFLANGFAAVLAEWVENDFQPPLEELVAICPEP